MVDNPEKIAKVNGHRIKREEAHIGVSMQVKYFCSSHKDCDLEAKCKKGDVGKSIMVNHLKTVARELKCPAKEEDVNDVAEQIPKLDIILEYLK